MTAHIIQSRANESGKAKVIHFTKLTCCSNASSMKPVKTRLVGVPVRVAMPPIDEAYLRQIARGKCRVESQETHRRDSGKCDV